MKVLTVIPVSKSVFADELTYFSVREAPLGSLVEITVRGKVGKGLVIGSKDVGDMKAIIRGGTFKLQKIGATPPEMSISSAFITAIEKTAHYHASPMGIVLANMLPGAVIETSTTALPLAIRESNAQTFEAYALQTNKDDRYATYKNSIRESFARKHSVLIIAPNVRTAETLYKALSTGIDQYVYVHHSKLTKRALTNMWGHLCTETHPVAVIVTPSYIYTPRADIGTIIVEQASAESFVQMTKPYLDTRVFARIYAQALRARIIFGDTVLPARFHKEIAEGAVFELEPLRSGVHTSVHTDIIDMRRKKDDGSGETTPFSIFSPQVTELLQGMQTSHKRIALLAPRRGLAPITVCRDCKNVVTCNVCQAPVTLHTNKLGEREFLCLKCGVVKSANTTCATCNSWRLDTLGIGIERVINELAHAFPTLPITRIDKETCKTDKQLMHAWEEYQANGGVLLGTQRMLDIMDNMDMIVVVSIDALLSVPDFAIDETVFRLLLTLKERTRESLLIQTRMPGREVLATSLDTSIAEFMRNELHIRETLNYPPYSVMVRITKLGTKKKIIEEYERIMPSLMAYKPRVFKQFERIKPNMFALHCLIRVPASEWPHQTLVEFLKGIQPAFQVRIA